MFSKLGNIVRQGWKASFGKHLLLTNCVSCGGFFLIGDALQQKIEMTQNPGQKFDYNRTLRLALVGLSQVRREFRRSELELQTWVTGSSSPLLVPVS